MELAKVEHLLEAYFEGNTSLAQEQELRTYFSEHEVPPHLEVYRPMFKGFELAKEEVYTKTVDLTLFENPAPKQSRFWTLGIAASTIALLGLATYFMAPSGLSAEEQEALAAFKKTQETMLLLSENLNEGASSISHLEHFEKGIETIAVLHEFNESKNLILK